MSLKIYCVDIGNTRTHCATAECDGFAVRISQSSDYPSSAFAELFESENLFAKSGATCISWCSVVPKRSLEFSKKLLGLDSMQLTCDNSPIALGIKNPSQLGQDRIADAVGASVFFKPPYIVVDMGTAVTIDLVDADGVYAGGAIAPGMHAFAAYLGERAAQLPVIDPSKADFSLTIGRDTVEAMYVGCAKGFCKLADGIIEDIERDYFGSDGAWNKTVFTGGSVSLLPKKWLAGRKIECNLAQIGLALCYIKNRKIKL